MSGSNSKIDVTARVVMSQSVFFYEEFSKLKQSNLEMVEGIELLRALDVGLKIKTLNLKGDSFSVDVFEDYTKAQDRISRDRYLKFYR